MATLCRRLLPRLGALYAKSHCTREPILHFSRITKAQECLISPLKSFSSTQAVTAKETVPVTFVLLDGTKHTVNAKVGDNLLDIIIENDLDIDGFGACEGTLACSTCHLIFKQEDFDQIKDPPTDEELDMLDLAYGLTDRSRLGCQVIVTKEMSGMEVKVPAGVADAREV